MHKENLSKVLKTIKDTDLVLDIGGWAHPFERADYVLDALPYETRGRRPQVGGAERFTKETWTVFDICNREPWPFKDKQFDFVICSHVLEDIRDPIWVCSELVRVSKAGYIETPARAAELLYGVQGFDFSGFQHHRWFVELKENKLTFTQKTPLSYSQQKGYYLIHTESILSFFWKNDFEFVEDFAGVDQVTTGKKMLDWRLNYEKSMPLKIKMINHLCRWLPTAFLKKNFQKTFRSFWKLERI